MNFKYTNEKNIQMLIYLLKENNIRKVIVNPGTMNMSFVTSIQNDSFFDLYSCVDERSACYMACGLSSECGEPVVLTCTGATASRNYLPGMTEAYYRKLPILAITCTPHLGNIGHNIPQMIDRTSKINDTYKFTCSVPSIHTALDAWADNVAINNAILELKRNGGGPVQINLGTEVTKVFDVQELPVYRKITRFYYDDVLPKIPNNKKVAVYVGNHSIWTEELTEQVDKFCEKYNAFVICDHTSNYYGKYKIMLNILCDQEKYISELLNFDLLIHIGNTSGAYMKFNVKDVWRVSIDGELVDTFKKLSNIYEMKELQFFEKYNEFKPEEKNTTNYFTIKKEIDDLRSLVEKKNIGFSNLYVAKQIIPRIPSNSTVHLAILNTLRCWNYFDIKKDVRIFCNTGGFGIDGMMSTLIGASFANTSKLYFGIVGDLAFFYDMNSLGNRCINNNLRILLINNGCGTEFHNYSHPASMLGDDMVAQFIAADGHYGNKSRKLVKDYVENLGFKYISASNKDSFEKQLDYFTSSENNKKPIVFEVFTDSNVESESLYKIRTLKSSAKGIIKHSLKKNLTPSVKNKLKKIVGD